MDLSWLLDAWHWVQSLANAPESLLELLMLFPFLGVPNDGDDDGDDESTPENEMDSGTEAEEPGPVVQAKLGHFHPKEPEEEYEPPSLEEIFDATTEYSREMIEANVAAAKDLAAWNVEMAPTYSGVSLQMTGTATAALDEMLARQFEASLDRVMPTWREDIVDPAMQAQRDSVALTNRFRENVLPSYLAYTDAMSIQALENNMALLRGEIPPDVRAQIERENAETATYLGVRGQASNNLTARDLGLTSLELQEKGLANAQLAQSIGPFGYAQANQTLQAPVTTGGNVTNLVNTFRAPMSDPTALYATHFGVVSGAGIINPTSAYSTNAQISATGGSLVMGQAQMESQHYWNQKNYEAQMAAIEAQKKASRGGALGGLIGGGFGAVLGLSTGLGPLAGLVGFGMGGQTGSQFGYSYF